MKLNGKSSGLRQAGNATAQGMPSEFDKRNTHRFPR